jgi:hypothetical protein
MSSGPTAYRSGADQILNGLNHGPFGEKELLHPGRALALRSEPGDVAASWRGFAAPLSGQFQAPGIGEAGWLRLIIWLAAISLWALTSLRVLSQSPGPAARR